MRGETSLHSHRLQLKLGLPSLKSLDNDALGFPKTIFWAGSGTHSSCAGPATRPGLVERRGVRFEPNSIDISKLIPLILSTAGEGRR
jgi:hypothetical protein